MTTIDADGTKIRAGLALAMSALLAFGAAGVAWSAGQSRINQGEERDVRLERRVERLEETSVKTMQLLGRIDERTAAIQKQLDREHK